MNSSEPKPMSPDEKLMYLLTRAIEGHLAEGEAALLIEGVQARIRNAQLPVEEPQYDNILFDANKRSQLSRGIAGVLNKHSGENGSNTPDFVLAEFLVNCLTYGQQLIVTREGWYGKFSRPGE